MKKLLTFMLFVTLLFFIGYSNNAKPEPTSDLILQNIEALASGETSGKPLKCWRNISDDSASPQTHVTYCGNCDAILARTWSRESQCQN